MLSFRIFVADYFVLLFSLLLLVVLLLLWLTAASVVAGGPNGFVYSYDFNCALTPSNG